MSATMKEEAFSAYFGNCPIVYVSGRSYPVTLHYLGDVHELVGRGQRQQAVEGGKVLPSPPVGGKRAVKAAAQPGTWYGCGWDRRRPDSCIVSVQTQRKRCCARPNSTRSWWPSW